MSSKRAPTTSGTSPKTKRVPLQPQPADIENIPPSKLPGSRAKQPLQPIQQPATVTAQQCIQHAATLEAALQWQAADTVYMQALVTNVQPIADIIAAYTTFKQRWSVFQLNSSLQATPANHIAQRPSAVQHTQPTHAVHHSANHTAHGAASNAAPQRAPMIHTHHSGKINVPPPQPIAFTRDYKIAYNEQQLQHNGVECQFEEVRARVHTDKYCAQKASDCDMDFTVAISSHIHQLPSRTQNIAHLKQVQPAVAVYNDMLNDSSDNIDSSQTVLRNKQVIVPVPTSTKKAANPLIRTPRSAVKLGQPSPTVNTKYALDAVNSMFHDNNIQTPSHDLLSNSVNRPSPVAFAVYEDEATRSIPAAVTAAKHVNVQDRENMPPPAARHSEQFTVYNDLTTSSTSLLKHNTGDKTREMLLNAQQPITPYSAAAALSSELDDSSDNAVQAQNRLTNDFQIPRNSLAPIVELSHESDHSNHTGTVQANTTVAQPAAAASESTVVDPYDMQHRNYVISELQVNSMPTVHNYNTTFDIAAVLSGRESDIEFGSKLMHIESIVHSNTDTTAVHTPSVLNVQDVDEQRDLQLSVYTPCNAWSYYISTAIQSRLQDSSMFALVDTLYQYTNCSIACTALYDTGSLQQCIDMYTAQQQHMHDTLVMYYAIEMLRCVAHLHAAQILHTNLRASDFLLLNRESGEWSDWCTGRVNGWASKGLLLSNFNSCVDRTVFPEQTVYLSSLNACDWQQLLQQPWCIECDLYAVADIMHQLLYNKKLQLAQNSEDNRLCITDPYESVWHQQVWHPIFDRLLNCGTHSDSAALLCQCQQELETILSSDVSRSTQVKVLLCKQAIMLANHKK